MTVLVTPLVPGLLGRQPGPVRTHSTGVTYETDTANALHVIDNGGARVASYRLDDWSRVEVQDTDHRDELERLAQWIVDNVPGEPSTSDGVYGIVTRLLTPLTQPAEAEAVGEVDLAARQIEDALSSDDQGASLDAGLDDLAAPGTPAAFRLALRAASRVDDLALLLARIEDIAGMSGEVRRIGQIVESKSREAHQAARALDMAREIHRDEMATARRLLDKARRAADEARAEVHTTRAMVDQARDEAARLRGELPGTRTVAVGGHLTVETGGGAAIGSGRVDHVTPLVGGTAWVVLLVAEM